MAIALMKRPTSVGTLAGRIGPRAGDELPTVLTTAELAALLKVSERTVRKRKYPRLPGPGRPRYLLSEVLAYDPACKRSA